MNVIGLFVLYHNAHKKPTQALSTDLFCKIPLKTHEGGGERFVNLQQPLTHRHNFTETH